MTQDHASTRPSLEVSTARGRSVMSCNGPSTYNEHMIQANAIGRSSKTVREFLEKNHKDDMSRDDTIKLTVKSLLEVVQTGAKNIEISVMESYGKITVRLWSLRRRQSINNRSSRVSIWHRSRPSSQKLSARKKLVRSTF